MKKIIDGHELLKDFGEVDTDISNLFVTFYEIKCYWFTPENEEETSQQETESCYFRTEAKALDEAKNLLVSRGLELSDIKYSKFENGATVRGMDNNGIFYIVQVKPHTLVNI